MGNRLDNSLWQDDFERVRNSVTVLRKIVGGLALRLGGERLLEDATGRLGSCGSVVLLSCPSIDGRSQLWGEPKRVVGSRPVDCLPRSFFGVADIAFPTKRQCQKCCFATR
jgi:hypothetical protein